MKIKVAGFEKESFVDGDGVRFTVFTQGCPHHCVGCHNPETHDFDSGTVYDTEDILQMISADPLISGITLSGGEPICQSIPCLDLARKAHQKGLNVWCYTGYLFEDIKDNPLLQEVDVLVDGEFKVDLKSLELSFRGSSNQRIIDVQKSLATGEVVLY